MTVLERMALLLLAVLPWSEGGASPLGLFVVHTLLFAAAAAVLLRSRKEGSLEMRAPWPLLAFLPFALAGGVSFLRSEYLFGSFETYWDRIAGLFLAAALACAIPSKTSARVAPAIVAAAGVAQSLAAIVSRVTQGASLSPSFVNPNHLAAYLNVAALVAAEHAGWGLFPGAPLPPATARTRFWKAAVILCALGVVAIGSRGALLALFVTLGAALLLRGPGRAAYLKTAVPVAMAIAALAIISVQWRFASTADPYRYDRPRLWAAAAGVWMESPVLGIGPGMYEHRSLRHNFPQSSAVFRWSKEPHSAHSQPLQTLAEEGALGAAALLLFAAVAAASLWSCRLADGERGIAARACIPAAAAIAVHSLFETPFEAPAIPMTLMILAWPALSCASFAGSAAGFRWRLPGFGADGASGARARMDRRAISASITVAMLVLFGVAVAAPYFSHVAARYAEKPGTPPIRIDAAVRLSEKLNPFQPFLSYRRARAALTRAERISPPLLVNALESLERTARLEPGDPGAYALMGRLYALTARDFPGAGRGAFDASERLYSDAIARAPLDARLYIERASLRLTRGAALRALDDVSAALSLEPAALAARQIEVESFLSLGRLDAATKALGRLDETAARLRGYEPRNGYEAALMRMDRMRLEEARSRLGVSLLILPFDLLRGGHREIRSGRLLGEDLVEEGRLARLLLREFPVTVGMPRHARLAYGRLDRLPGHRLDGVIEKKLAARAVVVDGSAEAQSALRHGRFLKSDDQS